jgi:DNA-binding NarL/FixJ family response regulator
MRERLRSVLVVDNHEPWRAFIRAVLQNHPRWAVVAEATTGPGAIRQARALQPDLILMDVAMPGLSGLDAARRILAVEPRSNILFLSVHPVWSIVEAALLTGARGYLLKSDVHRLLPAMDAISEGQPFISEGLTCERAE